MFSNSQQKIPEVFRIKMNIDKAIIELKGLPVIDFAMFKNARQEQAMIRMGCEKFIQRQRGPEGN